MYTESYFYDPQIESNATFTFDEPESKHITRVVRLQVKDEILVTDGCGRLFTCVIQETKPLLKALCQECIEEERKKPQIHVSLAVLKGRDLEVPVEGLCQLPLADIQLVLMDKCQVPPGKNLDSLVTRLEQKSITGLKQSKKLWLTKVAIPVSFPKWLETNASIPILIAHPGEDNVPKNLEKGLNLLIGPEGGFSDREFTQLKQLPNSYFMGLGSTRLRAMHAPLVACGKLLSLGLL